MNRKRITAFLMTLIMMVMFVAGVLPSPQASAAGTGVGLAQHALSAYYNGWLYRYGASGQTSGGRVYSDCSGLIYSYTGTARSSGMQISSAPQSGSLSSLPRIHGLGLWQPGHVGVYVGGGMAVDCRDTSSNTVYSSVYSHNWQMWYKVPGVSYPTTGWVTFNGGTYYYEDGQYVVSCTKTIDGVTYSFDANGLCGSAPSNVAEAPQVEAAPVQQSTPSVSYSQSSSGSGSASQSNSGSGSTAAAAPVSYQDLALGSKGAAVTRLQTRLSELDYYYEGINDYYDSLVNDAVALYQKAAGLEVTGSADVATQESLFSSDAPLNEEPGTVFPGYHSSIVRQLQERLIELGYMEGETSFFYGDATKAAVMAYEEAAGLEADGILTMDEQNVLYSDDAIPAPVEEPEEPAEEPAEDAETDGAEPAAASADAEDSDSAVAGAQSQLSRSAEDPAAAAAASVVESVSSAAEVTKDMFITTVDAAAKDGSGSQADDAGNGVIAFAIVVFGTVLTACIFVVRKKQLTVKELAAAATVLSGRAAKTAREAAGNAAKAVKGGWNRVRHLHK